MNSWVPTCVGVREVSEQDTVVVGGLEIRPLERVVLVDGHDVPLTTAEFDIVMMLVEHPGWVYSADQLSGDPVEGDLSPESVSVLVSRLRHKLSEAGLSDLIETVRGFGYRLRAPSGASEERTGDATACELRDAAWQLQEAVIEVEHSGTPAQQRAAVDALEIARRIVYSALAE